MSTLRITALGITPFGISALGITALGAATPASPVALAASSKPAPGPGAAASAWAVRITIPGRTGASASVVKIPPQAGRLSRASFSYPRNGGVIVTGKTTASAQAVEKHGAAAVSSSAVTDLSLFNGEITADSLVAHATATTASPRPSGSFDGTGVVNLQALGHRRARGRLALADWGYLTIASHEAGRVGPVGTKALTEAVTALDVHLTAAHGGLPAGSEIQLGYAEVDVHTAPAPTPGPLPGDRPQLLPPTTEPLIGVPQLVQPELAAGPYVFPVFGPSSFDDAYGTTRAGTGYHHGDDILGELGQPLLAVADGTVFSVGWGRVAGNRLALRDHAGDVFSYAHLSAFSSLAVQGAHVRAGQVIGFMGDTGDTEGKAAHLHFEVHPVSMLFLGPDGAVDPTSYLESWRRLAQLAFPVATGWAPKVPGTIQAPQPGAVLLGVTDISSADGLAPSSLRRVAPAGGG